MLTLFEHPLSPYVQKIKIALLEKNIEHQLVPGDLTGLAEDDGGFSRASLRREIPAIISDGDYIFDSTIILEYLEEKWPEPPLMPGTPGARARVRQIEEVCDSVYEACVWGLMELNIFNRVQGSLKEKMITRTKEEIAGYNRYLAAELGSAPWLNGDSFGRADLAAIPVVHGASTFEVAPQEETLQRWLERCRQRSSVQPVLEAGDESLEMMPQVASAIAQGLWSRQYRDHRLEWAIRNGGQDYVEAGVANKSIRFSRKVDSE